MNTKTHKDGTIITGLPDGGATISFPDAPPHHREGRIEVSFSAKTIRRMQRLGKRALKNA